MRTASEGERARSLRIMLARWISAVRGLVELAADFLARIAVDHQPEHFELAFAQLADRGPRLGLAPLLACAALSGQDQAVKRGVEQPAVERPAQVVDRALEHGRDDALRLRILGISGEGQRAPFRLQQCAQGGRAAIDRGIGDEDRAAAGDGRGEFIQPVVDFGVEIATRHFVGDLRAPADVGIDDMNMRPGGHDTTLHGRRAIPRSFGLRGAL